MKVYIYKWTDCFPGLICISILFKTWRKPYKYLNTLCNRLRLLFKNIDIACHSEKSSYPGESDEDAIKWGINHGWLKSIKVI